MLGKIKGRIRVVPDAVTDRQKELHRLINRIHTFSHTVPREVSDDPMVTVDDGGGVEKGFEIFLVASHKSNVSKERPVVNP
jgi:hypothetical protein